MVTQKEAVQLWEDHVGDSGHAPTDEELHQFALAVEKKARKPFEKLAKKWERKRKEYQSYATDNWMMASLATRMQREANAYEDFTDRLKKRLDARN